MNGWSFTVGCYAVAMQGHYSSSTHVPAGAIVVRASDEVMYEMRMVIEPAKQC